MENNQILSNIGQVDTDGTSASTEAFNESLNVAPSVGRQVLKIPAPNQKQ